MSFEEEFDKVIRQKVQQHDVPFDQTNWEKAQNMIDGQRTTVVVKKTMSMAKVLSIVGFVSAVAVSGYFVLRNNASHQSSVAAAQSTQSTNISNHSQNPSTTSQSDFNATTNTAKPTAENVTLNEQAKSQLTEVKHNLKSSQIVSTDLQRPQNQALAVSSRDVKTNVVNHDDQFKTSVVNNANGQLLSGELNQTNENNDNESSNLNQNKSANSNENIASGSTEIKQSSPSVTEIGEASGITQSANLASNISNQSAQLAYQFLSPHTIQNSTQADTALKAMPLEVFKIHESTIVEPGKVKTRFLNFGLGANYTNGWSTNQGQDGQGFNYFAHLNYGFYVSRKLSLGAGLDFYNVQNIKQAFYTFQKTEYSFTSSNTFTSVISNNLKYIGIPLKLYFDLNVSNILSIGLLPSFLIGSQNTIQAYQQLDGQKTNLSETKNQLLYEGIAQKNIQLSIGYKTKLSGRIWFQSDIMFGLSDLFQNNSSNSVKQRPLGLRLGLQYHIFDK